jgi:toxin ParE1/3/4
METAGDAVALRFESATRETFQELLRMPQIGSPQYHPRFPGMRRWRVRGFEKHLIFYRQSGDNIEIIRILHSSRDINRIFL